MHIAVVQPSCCSDLPTVSPRPGLWSFQVLQGNTIILAKPHLFHTHKHTHLNINRRQMFNIYILYLYLIFLFQVLPFFGHLLRRHLPLQA